MRLENDSGQRFGVTQGRDGQQEAKAGCAPTQVQMDDTACASCASRKHCIGYLMAGKALDASGIREGDK